MFRGMKSFWSESCSDLDAHHLKNHLYRDDHLFSISEMIDIPFTPWRMQLLGTLADVLTIILDLSN